MKLSWSLKSCFFGRRNFCFSICSNSFQRNSWRRRTTMVALKVMAFSTWRKLPKVPLAAGTVGMTGNPNSKVLARFCFSRLGSMEWVEADWWWRCAWRTSSRWNWTSRIRRRLGIALPNWTMLFTSHFWSMNHVNLIELAFIILFSHVV